MALVSLWVVITALRRHPIADSRALLRATAIGGPMGFLAIEAGWTVTEVGRQPWIVYEVLRTADAVTPMPGLVVPFITFTLLYCLLGAIVLWLLTLHVHRSPRVTERDAAGHAARRIPA
jgi:cytochrome d ubiquinol oxidase subunit I